MFTCDICGKDWPAEAMAYFRSAPGLDQDGLASLAPAVCDECDAAGIW